MTKQRQMVKKKKKKKKEERRKTKEERRKKKEERRKMGKKMKMTSPLRYVKYVGVKIMCILSNCLVAVWRFMVRVYESASKRNIRWS